MPSGGVAGALPFVPTAKAVLPGPAAMPLSAWYWPSTGNEVQLQALPFHLARPPVIMPTSLAVAHVVPAVLVATPSRETSLVLAATRDHFEPVNRKVRDQ